jgi:hypothetical protein
MKKNCLIGALLLSVFAINASATTADFNYGYKSLDVNPAAGTFEDSYTFELIGFSSITYNVLEIPQSFEGISIYDFSSFTYGLFNSSNIQISDSSSLDAGIYTLKISGETSGILGGYYRINATVASLPVPEPDTSMMVLFGLSMIGLASLRKSYFA